MSNYDPYSDKNLTNIEGYIGRLKDFIALNNLDEDFNDKSVLIFGSALGGECFAAAQLKAREVLGIEIDEKLIKNSLEIRNKFYQDFNVDFILYNGNYFKSTKKYDYVISGHVIEHVKNANLHLKNLIDLCAINGHIFIEFPTRYSLYELHTNLISFEFLPKILRNFCNHYSYRFHKLLNNDVKANDRLAINSTLNQISTSFIARNIRKSNWKIKSKSKAAKGIIRLIITNCGAKGN